MEFICDYPLFFIIVSLTYGIAICSCMVPQGRTEHRMISLYASLWALFFGFIMWWQFDCSKSFQFLISLNLISSYNFTLAFGVDSLSLVFLLLTLYIMPICFLAAWKVKEKVKNFVLYLLFIELLLVLTFTIMDIFYFFIFFESILIPMFVLIGSWGSRPRKIKAAYYLFLYTFFGSLFMLFGIFYLYLIVGSTNFFVLLDAKLTLEQQKIIWICFFMAFAIKMPLFPFHIWLPEAHVEAPTVGSIILASLLLKLGGYGFLRFSFTLLADASYAYAPKVYALSILGIIYASVAAIRQIDLKRVIAYSSIAHMNLVTLGLFSFNQQGIDGAIYLMLAHGFVSSGLFFAVGVLYDRYHSRLIHYYSGLTTTMPLFSFFFLIFIIANMSFPGTGNFVGELLVFTGLFNSAVGSLILSSLTIILSAIYSLLPFNRIVFGTLQTHYVSANNFKDLTCRETVVFIFLLIPTLFLGWIGDPIFQLFSPYTTSLISNFFITP